MSGDPLAPSSASATLLTNPHGTPADDSRAIQCSASISRARAERAETTASRWLTRPAFVLRAGSSAELGQAERRRARAPLFVAADCDDERSIRRVEELIGNQIRMRIAPAICVLS